MRRLLAVALVSFVGSCSNLTVKTSVYNGTLDSVVTSMSFIIEGLDRLELKVAQALPALEAGAKELITKYSEAFASGPDAVAHDFGAVLQETLDKTSTERGEIRTEATKVRQLASGPCVTDIDLMALNRRARRIQATYDSHVQRVSAGLEERLEDNLTDVQTSVTGFYAVSTLANHNRADQKEKLARLTRLDKVTGSTIAAAMAAENNYLVAPALITAAIMKAEQKLNDTARMLDNIFQREVGPEIAAVEDTVKASAAIMVAPLSDAEIGRIVDAPEQYWTGIYNRVCGSTWFGNAEIAIRMENLGQFNMKGVVFDPSQVTKAAVDGIAATVAVAAAASGVPVVGVKANSGNGNAENGETATVSKASIAAEAGALRAAMRERELLAAKLFSRILQQMDKKPDEDGSNRDALAQLIRDYASKIGGDRKP